MNTVINEFLKHYPEYNTSDYWIDSIESYRYGGDYELFIYDSTAKNCLAVYWCKLWNNEAETTYVFEKEEDYDIMKVRVNVDFLEDITINYNYTGDIFNEELVVNKFTEENDAWIRKEIANRILSGEIPIKYSCADLDGWCAPPSQIDKIYEV